jgi:hypothetical protein
MLSLNHTRCFPNLPYKAFHTSTPKKNPLKIDLFKHVCHILNKSHKMSPTSTPKKKPPKNAYIWSYDLLHKKWLKQTLT